MFGRGADLVLTAGVTASTRCLVDRSVRRRSATVLLDAMLTRRATRTWWIATGAFFSLALVMHSAAWLALPAITTADGEEYCQVLHTLERGEIPSLVQRNIGYPLFLLGCKLLVGPLTFSAPLVQHVAGLLAVLALIVWMRRVWGVLASVAFGALMLANSIHAFWPQYAQPNALLSALVPFGVMAIMNWCLQPSRRQALVAVAIWSMVLVTRDEVLLIAFIVPAVVWVFVKNRRRNGAIALASLVGIAMAGGALRVGVNSFAAGAPRHSTHFAYVLSWRVFGQEALVAPPRPPQLDRLYLEAEARGATKNGERMRINALWGAAQEGLGLTHHEAANYIKDCAVQCVLRRPGAFITAGLRDSLRLWVDPSTVLEWELFRLMNPAKFARDSAKFPNRPHRWAEFETGYQASAALGVFKALAPVRPGSYFAMTPLAVCFAVGCTCLFLGVGTARRRVRRWWFGGVAVAVIVMSLFYGFLAEPTDRFRMSFEWAFFAIAALGVVLPLHALRRRIAPAAAISGRQTRYR